PPPPRAPRSPPAPAAPRAVVSGAADPSAPFRPIDPWTLPSLRANEIDLRTRQLRTTDPRGCQNTSRLVRSILSSSPPTLKEVARAAGVSRATASRVLSEGRPAGDLTRRAAETRRAVERAARSLGYVPNR